MTETADPPAPPPRPVFCRRCGTTLDPAAAKCGCSVKPALPVDTSGDSGPSMRSALSLYFSLLTLSGVAIIYAQARGPRSSGAEFDIGLSVAFAVAVLPWALVYARPVTRLLRPRGAILWYGVALLAPLVTFARATATLWFFSVTVSLPILDETADYRRDGFGFGWVVFATCVIPGIFEEIAFRGVIYDGLSRHLTTVETVLVSAAMFGILHLSILSLPHLLLIGLALGVLRAKTGSLVAGMVMHFLHNLIVCSTDWWKSGSSW